ncbi:hypothetical protein UFOVP176_50 [uncultured Caudovirales phage]|uniref:Uncharacterized protein n=1 Tax=uncultured Caudovirales phage TaxID=2100421 RepID=A0A6J7WJ25_9CAUD|nr:hypothetical protein UFOVP176_50 [uncultured Caudovirales phage]
MESSNRTLGLLKGRYVDRSPQRNILRLSDLKQALEDQDWIESSVRHTRSVKAARANEGRRTQPRRLGKDTRGSEAGLQSNVAVDDEQKGRV